MTWDLDTPADSDLRLRRLALRTGMVTLQQLQRALSTQASEVEKGKLPRQLGLILLSDRILSEAQLEFLLRKLETFRTS